MTNVTSDILVAVLLDRFDDERPPEENRELEFGDQTAIPGEIAESLEPKTA
jgi:hypothetical protein